MGGEYFESASFGTESYWEHPFGLIYTDSVREFAQDKQAYWVLDVVSSYRHIFNKYPFLVVFFDVADNHCTFHAREDSDKPDIVNQFIEYTDLTVSLKLYLVDEVLMFPSDY
jgi:hypothetical protein